MGWSEILIKRRDQFNRDITEERTQKYTISTKQMLKIITKMWNRQRNFSFYFFKCMQVRWRGADDNMFYVLYLVRASELCFGSWGEFLLTLRPYLCCQTEVCAQHDVSHTDNTDKAGGATEVIEFFGGHICWACVWVRSRACRSTYMSRRCSRSGSFCRDSHELLALHTH